MNYTVFEALEFTPAGVPIEGTSSWEVRVSSEGRHNGKLIASCPSERLANLVVNALDWAESEAEINWNNVFEVTDGAVTAAQQTCYSNTTGRQMG